MGMLIQYFKFLGFGQVEPNSSRIREKNREKWRKEKEKKEIKFQRRTNHESFYQSEDWIY